MSFSNLTRDFSNKCCGLGQNYNLPAPIENLMIFELTGYNYKTLPEWFDMEGVQMEALQFSIEHSKLKYTWSFYKKEGDNICSSFFHLLTSDDIFPVIYEKITESYMKVERIAQTTNYTSWKISCLN
jgi:hypothetical protein